MKIVFVGGPLNDREFSAAEGFEPPSGKPIHVEFDQKPLTYYVTSQRSGDRIIAFYIPPAPSEPPESKT